MSARPKIVLTVIMIRWDIKQNMMIIIEHIWEKFVFHEDIRWQYGEVWWLCEWRTVWQVVWQRVHVAGNHLGVQRFDRKRLNSKRQISGQHREHVDAAEQRTSWHNVSETTAAFTCDHSLVNATSFLFHSKTFFHSFVANHTYIDCWDQSTLLWF